MFPGATSPARDGASAFVSATLSLLAREGCVTHLVVPSFLEPRAALEGTYACASSRWLLVPPPRSGLLQRVRRTATALGRGRPSSIDLYAAPEVIDEVRRAAAASDLVVGFGAASSPIVARAGKPSLVLLFSLPLGDARRAGARSFARWLAGRFEAGLHRRHRLVALTTPAEQERLSAAMGAPAIWLPHPRGRRGAAAARPSADRIRLLFIADWNYPPNRNGLEFLLTDVMPTVWERHPTAELVLAGKGSDELELNGLGGPVRCWGQYDLLEELVDGSTIAVLPLLDAGGVRTRLLELLDAGVPVVATEAAAGGLEVGGGVVTVRPSAFGERLLEIMDSPATERALRQVARDGANDWPSDAEVAERWRSAFDLLREQFLEHGAAHRRG